MRPPRLDILVEVQMHIKYGFDISHLAPVVQEVDNAIPRKNCYPVEKCLQNKPPYSLDCDLSGGQSYPPFEQLRPDGPRYQQEILHNNILNTVNRIIQ